MEGLKVFSPSVPNSGQILSMYVVSCIFYCFFKLSSQTLAVSEVVDKYVIIKYVNTFFAAVVRGPAGTRVYWECVPFLDGFDYIDLAKVIASHDQKLSFTRIFTCGKADRSRSGHYRGHY